MEKHLKKKKKIIKLNHFAVHLKLTQHCKSTILKKKTFKDSNNITHRMEESISQIVISEKVYISRICKNSYNARMKDSN